MIQRASELRVKEVVSINDGRRLGFMFDLEIDMDTGKVISFVIPSGTRVLGFLGGRAGGELVIELGSHKEDRPRCHPGG